MNVTFQWFFHPFSESVLALWSWQITRDGQLSDPQKPCCSLPNISSIYGNYSLLSNRDCTFALHQWHWWLIFSSASLRYIRNSQQALLLSCSPFPTPSPYSCVWTCKQPLQLRHRKGNIYFLSHWAWWYTHGNWRAQVCVGLRYPSQALQSNKSILPSERPPLPCDYVCVKSWGLWSKNGLSGQALIPPALRCLNVLFFLSFFFFSKLITAGI